MGIYSNDKTAKQTPAKHVARKFRLRSPSPLNVMRADKKVKKVSRCREARELALCNVSSTIPKKVIKCCSVE